MNSTKPIIEVKNLGKKYNINHQKGGYITLRDIMTNAIKNPFAFLKRKTKNILGIETKEEFWALKDVNFEVMKGEVIGIIGRNGAGKSTLLKILSQITPPSTGEIRIRGTVGSLLEVGTGFHPELSGRENIFLNGAILGMKKKDIERKFNEIVEFAGIEKFLDTPVKYYSSGMYVRLAFSVAAHMETDILIIDEVLAVGDAEFQKKCLGKMEDITQKEGRTILFVSHNMGAIEKLCNKCILLEKGEIIISGETENIIKRYSQKNDSSTFITPINSTQINIVEKIEILDCKKLPRNEFEYGETLIVSITTSSKIIKDFGVTIRIKKGNGEIIGSNMSIISKNNKYFNSGDKIFIKIEKLILTEGQYTIDIIINKWGVEHFENICDSIYFNLTSCIPNNFPFSIKPENKLGNIIIPNIIWEKE
jgi:lipopolysaccharide transport system ATP-binding protein